MEWNGKKRLNQPQCDSKKGVTPVHHVFRKKLDTGFGVVWVITSPAIYSNKLCKSALLFSSLFFFPLSSFLSLSTMASTLTMAGPLMNDMFMQNMLNNKIPWGDLVYSTTDMPIIQSYDDMVAQHSARVQEAVSADLVAQEAAFWDQPWASNLTEYSSAGTNINMCALGDWQYEACMTWVHSHGWHIVSEDRNGFQGWPANEGSREWVRPLERPLAVRVWLADADVPAVKAATTAVRVIVMPESAGSARTGPKPDYIPLFCKDSSGGGELCEWAKSGTHCHYEHGDTLPRINRACKNFAQCFRHTAGSCTNMHRGEVFKTGMVIRRKVVA